MITTHHTTNGSATVQEVVGARLREQRERLGLRQEDVAEAARRWGLDWGRSSVAMIERGQRRVSAEELLVLPLLLDEAVRLVDPTANVNLGITLADLLRPAAGEMVAVTPRKRLTRRMIDDWLSSPPPGRNFTTRVHGSNHQWIGEADRKAALELGLTLAQANKLALELWDRTLTEEREVRLGRNYDLPRAPEATAEDRRARQAIRGHLTRRLLDDLRAAAARDVHA